MVVTLPGMIVALHPVIKVLVEVSMIALQFSRESYTGLLPSTTIEDRFGQPLNGLPSHVPFPILVNPSGIVIVVRPVQPEKALFPMLVTPSGSVMDVKPVQSLKTLSPILVNPSGSVMEVRPVQPQKASLSMLVTSSGIIVVLHPAINVLVEVSMIALQLSRESYTVLLELTMMKSTLISYFTS